MLHNYYFAPQSIFYPLAERKTRNSENKTSGYRRSELRQG